MTDDPIRYRHNTYTSEHPFGYDAAWTIALTLNASIAVLETKIFADNGTRSLEDYTYDDKEMTKVFFDEMAQISFKGVTVKYLCN